MKPAQQPKGRCSRERERQISRLLNSGSPEPFAPQGAASGSPISSRQSLISSFMFT